MFGPSAEWEAQSVASIRRWAKGEAPCLAYPFLKLVAAEDEDEAAAVVEVSARSYFRATAETDLVGLGVSEFSGQSGALGP